MHITKKDLERLSSGKLPARERNRIIRHLLTQCEPCLKLAREVGLESGEEQDYSGVLRRLELSYVVAEQEINEERIYARDVWDTFLSKLDSGQRLRAIRDNRSFQVWGLFDLFLDEAKRVVRDTPFEALDLIHASAYISELLPEDVYGEERIYDFRGTANAALGNIKRLTGDFEGAAQALNTSGAFLDKGTGDPYDRSNLISILSSLKTDLGMLEEAADLLGDAIALSRKVNDPALEAKLRIQQSFCIGYVDPERGLHLSYTALRLLKESRSTDRHLELGGLYLTAYWSNELGHEDEARATLETYRYLFDMFPDPVTQGRLLMLDALISRREGRLDYSERLFRQLVDLYGEHQMEFDLALASLEWAESLVLLRRFDEATDVMTQVYPLISSWNIHVDILRSWMIVKEAVRGQAIEDASFRELAMILRRKWHHRKD